MMTTGSASRCPDILKDVVAYVDVWSSDKTDNYSKSFIQQLQEMGAQVTKSFNKKVTHVVFKNGHHATWTKAKKTGVKLVSVLWVARCKDDGAHVDEELYPALNDDAKTVRNKKKHRCMQPGEERTPESDKRLKKKIDKMVKGLMPKPPFVTEDVSPYIIDHEHGIVYSPSWKRSESMAERLREMKAQRENISPTASQMVESGSSSGPQPSLGSSPTFLELLEEQTDEESSASAAAKLAHSSERDRSEEKRIHGDGDLCDHNPPLGKDSYSDVPRRKSWLSPCSDVPKHTSMACLTPSDESLKQSKKTRRTSTRIDTFQKQIVCFPDVSEGSKWGGRTRQTRLSFSKPIPENDKTTQSPIENNDTHPEVLSSLICTSVPSIAGNAVVNQEQIKGIVSQPSKVDQQAAKKPRHSLSLLLSATKAKTNTSSVDQDDDVFEDYFSVPSHRRTPQTVLLGSSKKKRRYSETTVPEKKKQDESTKKSCHETNGVSQKRSDQDIQADSHGTAVDSVTGNARTLPFMSKGEFTAQSVKRRRTLSTQPNKDFCSIMAGASFGQQKKSDVKVCSQTREFVGGGTEHAVAAGRTDSISENIQKTQDLKSVEGDKRNKTMRTLVMTSLSTDQQSTVAQVVKALGRFTIVDQVCESTTHVVAGRPRRTVNVLLGIARGCWILSFEWILWCLEKRQWIPEEPYEHKDSFPAAAICRLQQHLSAGEHQQDLLQGQPVMFVSAHTQPPADSLVELIELCGGTVSKTIRKAGICIGGFDRKRPEGCRILSEQWLLDSITNLKLLPYDDYELERRSP